MLCQNAEGRAAFHSQNYPALVTKDGARTVRFFWGKAQTDGHKRGQPPFATRFASLCSGMVVGCGGWRTGVILKHQTINKVFCRVHVQHVIRRSAHVAY